MDKSAMILSLTGLVLVPLITISAFKGTIFDVRYPQENPWPLIWYLELAIILISLLLVSYRGIANIPILYKSQPGTETEIAFVVIITLVAYIISLSFFLKIFKLMNRRNMYILEVKQIGKFEQLAFVLTISGTLLIIIFHVLQYKHAFITSILTGKTLLRIRLANKYFSNVPSQIASILPLIGYFLAALGGYIAHVGRYITHAKWFKGIFYLFVALLFLSASGDKTPPIWGIVIWIFAEGSLLPKRLSSLKWALTLLFIFMLSILVLYFAASLQYPELTLEAFLLYLFYRLGISQMGGVYETFGLALTGSLPEGDFYWHMIPGASFFIEYLDYHKVLMMITESRGITEMGVKNTYFIAEAYAIGGIFLMFLSPIIVGFSTALGLVILTRFMQKIMGKDISQAVTLMLYLRTHAITGGFSNFPLFKGLILLLGQLLILWGFCLMVSSFVKILIAMIQIIKNKARKR